MLRTNSKKYLNNIQTYLINAIDSDGYENQPTTDKEKISFLLDCYNSEYNHVYNIKRYPNEQTRFANWLSGLPSAISLPYYYDDIVELAKKLQETEFFTMTYFNEKYFNENYFNFMAYHILKLNNKLN